MCLCWLGDENVLVISPSITHWHFPARLKRKHIIAQIYRSHTQTCILTTYVVWVSIVQEGIWGCVLEILTYLYPYSHILFGIAASKCKQTWSLLQLYPYFFLPAPGVFSTWSKWKSLEVKFELIKVGFIFFLPECNFLLFCRYNIQIKAHENLQ